MSLIACIEVEIEDQSLGVIPEYAPKIIDILVAFQTKLSIAMVGNTEV